MHADAPGSASQDHHDPAWTDRELTNPHEVADKARRVREMFAAIAPSYDLNNRVHSLGRDQAWRRAAVKMAELKATDCVVDVACGTGDLTLAFADRLRDLNSPTTFPAWQVNGIDFTFEMLPLARRKSEAHVWPSKFMRPGYAVNPARMSSAVGWMNGDAMRLPLPSVSTDVVSIAFGIRNVARPEAAIAEFFRVLRPGGRVIILEFSLPTNPLMRGLYNFYFKHILPRTATLIARDRSGAYKYLPQSVNTFIDRPAMVSLLEKAGFRDVAVEPLTLGIAVIYRGVKR